MKKSNEKLTDSSVIEFGKYKGRKLANVPASWLLYAYDNFKIFPNLRAYIEENKQVLEVEVAREQKNTGPNFFIPVILILVLFFSGCISDTVKEKNSRQYKAELGYYKQEIESEYESLLKQECLRFYLIGYRDGENNILSRLTCSGDSFDVVLARRQYYVDSALLVKGIQDVEVFIYSHYDTFSRSRPKFFHK